MQRYCLAFCEAGFGILQIDMVQYVMDKA